METGQGVGTLAGTGQGVGTLAGLGRGGGGHHLCLTDIIF